jgi:hypothetical protein
MKLTMFLFITLNFISICCHNGHNKEPESKSTHNDTVIIDIPEWYTIGSFTQKMDKQLSALLNLESLRTGFDSLQIRIWIDCGRKLSNLIVLQRKGH